MNHYDQRTFAETGVVDLHSVVVRIAMLDAGFDVSAKGERREQCKREGFENVAGFHIALFQYALDNAILHLRRRAKNNRESPARVDTTVAGSGTPTGAL